MRLSLTTGQTIRLVFLFQAIAGGGLFTRIPDLQTGLGINEATLGLTLLGQTMGAILTFLFAATTLVERAGTRNILLYGIPCMALGQVLMALSPSAVVLFFVFAFYGSWFAMTNIAMNVEADRLEAAEGRRLMSSAHGLWSLGMLTAALVGTLMRGLDVSPLLHFSIMLPVALAAALFVVRPMQPAPPRPYAGTAVRRRITLPSVLTLALVGFAISGALAEVANRHWSVIYMRDSFDAPAWVDTLTLPAFMVAQTAGRLFGDPYVTRLGPVRAARLTLLVAVVGLLFIVLAPNLYVALGGFLMMGIGLSLAYPLATSATTRLGDRPASENVAAFTLTLQVLMLSAPAVMGFIANGLGIRMTFAIILPSLLLSLVLARFLAPRVTAAEPARA